MRKAKLLKPNQRLYTAYIYVLGALVFIVAKVLKAQSFYMSDLFFPLMLLLMSLPRFLTHRRYKKHYEFNNNTILAIPKSHANESFTNEELEKEIAKENEEYKKHELKILYIYGIVYFTALTVLVGVSNHWNLKSVLDLYPLYSVLFYIALVLIIAYKFVLKHKENATHEMKIAVSIILIWLNLLYAYSIKALSDYSQARFNTILIVTAFTLFVCVYFWLPKKKKVDTTIHEKDFDVELDPIDGVEFENSEEVAENEFS